MLYLEPMNSSYKMNISIHFRKLLALFLLCCISSVTPAATQQPDSELRNLLIKAINESNSFKDRYVAEVWLTDMSNRLGKRIKDTRGKLRFLRTLHHEATRANLYPEVVLAVIEVESNFDRFALSVSGARGMMQIMPFWLKEIGRPEDDLFNIQTNLRMGCTILRYYLDKEKGGPAQGTGQVQWQCRQTKIPGQGIQPVKQAVV